MIRDLKNGGYFVEVDRNGRELHEPIKNTLLETGASWFMRTVFRDESVLPATFYLGLTNVDYDWESTLADLALGEPSGNGYARQALNRDTTDFTVQEVNGFMQALSKIVTFTASGDWDKVWNRMFLCDASSGTSGDVVAVSGPAPQDRTVLTGQGPSIRYQFYLRG